MKRNKDRFRSLFKVFRGYQPREDAEILDESSPPTEPSGFVPGTREAEPDDRGSDRPGGSS